MTHGADADNFIYAGHFPELPDEKLDLEWGLTTMPDLARKIVVLHAGTKIWRDTRNVLMGSPTQIERLLRARYGGQDRVDYATGPRRRPDGRGGTFAP